VSRSLRNSAERHRAGPIVVTVNRGPRRVVVTFADPIRAQSTIDRFPSNAYDLVIDGESYHRRLKPGESGSRRDQPRKWRAGNHNDFHRSLEISLENARFHILTADYPRLVNPRTKRGLDKRRRIGAAHREVRLGEPEERVVKTQGAHALQTDRM
jgi:hypothetical protein